MYKKIALLSTLLCTFTQNASELRSWFEIKPSYFLFTECPMNDVYDDGGFEIQGSVSLPFCNCLDFYGSVGYRKVCGNALNTCEKTSLTVVPIDIGLKPIFNFCERFFYFFAIGPRFFYLHQNNNSPYVDCKVSGGDVGLFVNTGFNVQLSQCLLLGIFGEYSYEKITIIPTKPNVFSNGAVQAGGFAIGASVGFEF